MPVDHKLCSGLDPVGENLLSSLKSPPERWPRPTREAEETEETLAPLSELELDGCSGDVGMTLPRSETPLSTRGMRDTRRRILKHFILSLSRTLLELDCCYSKSSSKPDRGYAVQVARELVGFANGNAEMAM